MKSYYIASRLENIKQVQEVRDQLIGHFTYDWTLEGPVWKNGESYTADTIAAEVNGVITAGVLIMLLPGGRGAHCELGAALAHNIPILMFGDEELITLHEKSCGFYFHRKVIFKTSNIDELIQKANEVLKV